jgi:hypothetical protein
MTGGGWFAMHSDCFCKNTYIIETEKRMSMNTIFVQSRQKVGKVGKKSDFFYFTTFCCVIFQSQCMVSQPYGV